MLKLILSNIFNTFNNASANKMLLLLITIIFLLTSRTALAICNEGCNEPTLMYASLKCTPIYASPTDCCPSKFDCSHIEKIVNEGRDDVCYFEGKTYKIGDRVHEEQVYSSCYGSVNLFSVDCYNQPSQKPRFIRAMMDCAEVLKGRPPSGCTYKYDLRSCCSTGLVCRPFNVTCNVKDGTLHEGMKFTHPTKQCTTCVCKEGYNGQSDEPFCVQETCMPEITHQSHVYSFCAPAYRDNNHCCPDGWFCPKETVDVTTSKVASGGDHCIYGSYKLSVGDKFTRNGEATCECKIPPYVTCNINEGFLFFTD